MTSVAGYLLGDDVCPFSKHVDGPRHGWRFDGDDPYVECYWCGQYRDAQTNRIIRPGRTHIDGEVRADG